jgi:ATP-dependent helicase HrpB
LAALDETGRITPAGREMARLRATPRLAAMMVFAQSKPEKALAADIAAILEERDPLGRDASADIALRLEALAGKIEGDRAGLARIRQGAKIYRNRLGLGAIPAAGNAGTLLAAAFPDRIGQARGEPGAYRLSGGGSGALGATDKLREARLLVAASIEAKGGKIRLAAALDSTELPASVRAKCKTSRETAFDPGNGGVLTRERVRLGALILSDKFAPPEPGEVQATLAKAAASRLDQLNWTEATLNLQARVALMRRLDETYPDLSRETLAATTETWLAPYLAGMTNLRDVKNADLHNILRATLTYEQATRLDKDLPTELRLPGGTIPIDYTTPTPTASGRAKLFYGLNETPKLASGKIPLQLALLSPANRPIAITADLATFWRNGWTDARRDMRGRYPKHAWPEDPWNALG